MIKLKLILIFIFIQICFGEKNHENLFSKDFGDMFSNIWIQSLSATLLVSAAPVLVIFAIPDLKNHHNLLKILLAFAAGGLLGDAFLHLIPHSIDPHDHNSNNHGHSHDSHHGHSHDSHHGHSHDSHHGHSHDSHHGHSHEALFSQHDHTKNMIVGLWVVAGIMSFLCVEKFVRLVKGDHGHSHSITSDKSSSEGESVIVNRGESANSETVVRQRKSKENKSKKKENRVTINHHADDNIKVSGYLNLVADFAHNFTDGLAIGASFMVNKNVGIVTTITILFHELPHEIGDYAILIQSGCSRNKAILLQLVTAIGALFGTVISLISQDAGTTSIWILPFTAGGFIYISTVSVIPELLEEHTKLSQTIYEITAMIVGVGMMIAIAYFE